MLNQHPRWPVESGIAFGIITKTRVRAVVRRFDFSSTDTSSDVLNSFLAKEMIGQIRFVGLENQTKSYVNVLKKLNQDISKP